MLLFQYHWYIYLSFCFRHTTLQLRTYFLGLFMAKFINLKWLLMIIIIWLSEIMRHSEYMLWCHCCQPLRERSGNLVLTPSRPLHIITIHPYVKAVFHYGRIWGMKVLCWMKNWCYYKNKDNISEYIMIYSFFKKFGSFKKNKTYQGICITSNKPMWSTSNYIVKINKVLHEV